MKEFEGIDRTLTLDNSIWPLAGYFNWKNLEASGLMNQKENALAAQMLEMASGSYGNHGCNDWDWPEDWSIKERQAFVKSYHEWNGNPEEFDPKFLSLPDFAVMAFLAAKLKGEVKGEQNQ